MSRILCIITFFTITTELLAQKSLTLIEQQQDFKILENILKQGHPFLYGYTDQKKIDSIFTSTRESLTENALDIELFSKMQNAINYIKDAHLSLYAPETFDANQYYFPLLLKIIQTDFYTDTDDFGIPVGSKILKINGKDIAHILETLKKYVPADGNNLTRKYREIELKFGLFYAYAYGIKKEFTIEYIAPNTTKKSITLAAESFATVKNRSSKRNSYFAKYHSQENGVNFFSKYIGNHEPFVYYKDDLKTAVLVVNSFKVDQRIFKNSLGKIFKAIHSKKIKNLIIDLRNNEGGYRPNAIQLYTYITTKPFKQRTSTIVSSLEIPERTYATRSLFNEKELLKDKFYNHPTYDGWKLNFDDLETIMVPDRNRFLGNVYMLTSGATFSDSSDIALLAKNNPDILLIGEETGSSYYTHTGGFTAYYEFPNSKISMAMPMEKLTHYVRDKTIAIGSGVIPDRQVHLSVTDLIHGRDTQLDYVLQLIRGK